MPDVLPKRRLTFNGLNGLTSQKIELLKPNCFSEMFIVLDKTQYDPLYAKIYISRRIMYMFLPREKELIRFYICINIASPLKGIGACTA
jgi:hypothetical protein